MFYFLIYAILLYSDQFETLKTKNTQLMLFEPLCFTYTNKKSKNNCTGIRLTGIKRIVDPLMEELICEESDISCNEINKAKHEGNKNLSINNFIEDDCHLNTTCILPMRSCNLADKEIKLENDSGYVDVDINLKNLDVSNSEGYSKISCKLKNVKESQNTCAIIQPDTSESLVNYIYQNLPIERIYKIVKHHRTLYQLDFEDKDSKKNQKTEEVSDSEVESYIETLSQEIMETIMADGRWKSIPEYVKMQLTLLKQIAAESRLISLSDCESGGEDSCESGFDYKVEENGMVEENVHESSWDDLSSYITEDSNIFEEITSENSWVDQSNHENETFEINTEITTDNICADTSNYETDGNDINDELIKIFKLEFRSNHLNERSIVETGYKGKLKYKNKSCVKNIGFDTWKFEYKKRKNSFKKKNDKRIAIISCDDKDPNMNSHKSVLDLSVNSKPTIVNNCIKQNSPGILKSKIHVDSHLNFTDEISFCLTDKSWRLHNHNDIVLSQKQEKIISYDEYNEIVVYCRKTLEKYIKPGTIINNFTCTIDTNNDHLFEKLTINQIQYGEKFINNKLFGICCIVLNEIETIHDILDDSKCLHNYRKFANLMYHNKDKNFDAFAYSTQTNMAILRSYLAINSNGLIPLVLAQLLLELLRTFDSVNGDHATTLSILFPFLFDIDSRHLLVLLIRIIHKLILNCDLNVNEKAKIFEIFAPMIFPQSLLFNRGDKLIIKKFITEMLTYNFDYIDTKTYYDYKKSKKAKK